MNIHELSEKWFCSTRQIDLICEKGILNPTQNHERGKREFSIEEIESVEKSYNVVTTYRSMEEFAKRFNLHYMTVYNWVKADKIKSCKLFNPIRIPLTEKPSKRKKA
jgi:hypothetical protein